jgi:hypothetical protein
MSFEHIAGHALVGIIHNIIPPIDALGEVTCIFHGDRAGDAGAFEIPYRRPPKIMP